ncbi:phosphoesterase [Aliidiomarina sedimenti]|uniref:Phosphoesterase n=1 Tax=Aliidiomarina sedimenti TaxID=1933879 RepID=A0ABY0BXU6_9GAMM|nr:HAD-IA family hydrolase [Aliidiomarina sedimenti]RUO29153.1 phosphoesterase [Aliidiomarina sedimenti]
MIQFHRRLRPVKVISFDLDDTLYDNLPVMQQAEQALLEYLHQQFPQTEAFGLHDWRALRDKLAAADAMLATNMTALRQATLRHGLEQHGLAADLATRGAEDAMLHFLEHRNQVDVADDVHRLLDALAGRFPLLAISNGNADISKIGIGDYFTHAWQPSDRLRGKPTADMFRAAQQKLGFNPVELLHIGDHPVSDVQGAARFGAQTVWLNQSGRFDPRLTWLPTVTIAHLPLLSDFL